MNRLTSLLALFALAPFAAVASSYESGANVNLSALNPNSDTNVSQETASDRVVARLTAPVLTNAGTAVAGGSACAPCGSCSPCPWFRQPTVFVHNLFTNSNDSRATGLDTFQYRLQIGGDFLSYKDFIAGAIYTYGIEDGENESTLATTEFDKTSHHVTLYTGKSFGKWINAGATMDFGFSDVDTETFGITGGTDAFSYSPSFFLGLAQAWDQWGFSSTASYIYEDIYYDGGVNGVEGFNESTGTLTWKTQATWFATDWLDLSGFFKWTHLLHSNVVIPQAAGDDNDRSWATVGAKATFYPCKGWEAYAGIDYDVLNDNYGETVTGLVGAAYKF